MKKVQAFPQTSIIPSSIILIIDADFLCIYSHYYHQSISNKYHFPVLLYPYHHIMSSSWWSLRFWWAGTWHYHGHDDLVIVKSMMELDLFMVTIDLKLSWLSWSLILSWTSWSLILSLPLEHTNASINNSLYFHCMTSLHTNPSSGSGVFRAAGEAWPHFPRHDALHGARPD
jgi:hypothetical protein